MSPATAPNLAPRRSAARTNGRPAAALIGLTEAQVEAARTWADPELAEAMEAFGYELRKARQAKGDLKRRRRPNGPAEGEGVGEDGRAEASA